MNRATTLPLQSVDEFVEAYEAAHAGSLCASGSLRESGSSRENGKGVNLLDYLPAESSQLYHEVAAELIRIDMEHAWSRGEQKRLDSYQAMLPRVFGSKAVLGEVAYEEYRLRAQAGEQVSADQYHRQYGIPTEQWARWKTPQHPVPNHHSRGASSPSSLPELWQEALELAADVQDFPAAGDSFLGFSLEQELGQGAFSHVFLARQGELAERQVVLKIASGNSLEPQHLARLQHTNIVPIYSVHRQERLIAVCMPYFGRRTLADLLSAVRQQPDKLGSQQNLISTFLNRRDPTERMPISKPSPPMQAKADSQSKVLEVLTKSSYVDAVVWLVKQMAEGLAHAHERGIVHRDLKPANVLLTDEGLPMLLDFNLSQDVVVNGRTSLLVGGTLPYMSPEQLEAVTAGGYVGVQADIFSLGIIFYELLTGERPFPDCGGGFEEVVREMIADRQAGCPPLRIKNPAVPPSIEAVVHRCLAPNIHSRYGQASEFVEDLDRHLQSEPLRYAPDRFVIERSKKWLKRHPRISSAGGVAALASGALLLLLSLWMMRGHRLARFEAEGIFQTFREQHPSLHMALGVSHTDQQILRDSIASTRNDLKTYGVLEDEHWQAQPHYQSLTQSSRAALNRRLGEQLYLVARANEGLLATAKNSEDRTAAINDAFQANRLAMELYSPDSCPRALLLQQARMFDFMNSPDKAEKARQQAAGQPRESLVDQYDEIYDLQEAEKYHQAKPRLVALRDQDPTAPVPWYLLGYVNAGLGAHHESEGCFTTAVTLEPGSYLAYFQRGLCRMNLGQYPGALEDFQQVTKLRPQLAAGFLNRAIAHRSLKNYEQAIADLSVAIDLGASQTRIYFLRSDLRRLVGDIAGAAADTKLGLERTPTDELSWVSRGVAQLKTNPAAALADFRQALNLNPASSSALHNCVHVLADRLNRPDEALETVNQLLQINEKDTKALAGRAVLYARTGKREAALADIQQLLRLSKAPQALFQGACALSLTSSSENVDAAKALTLLSQAVQLEPMWFVRAHTDPDLQALRETEAFQTFADNTRNISRMKIDLNKLPGQE